MHHGQYVNAKTGETVAPSLKSDPIPEFIYKKMERRWAREFVKGSVQIGSLFYYRTIKDESGLIVDPHEGIEATEVTAGPFFGRMNGAPPVGTRIHSRDDRRLVFCASESTDVPREALPRGYDTWVQIQTEPSIRLIHQALLSRVPDADGPVFKKVIYDPDIDGPDDLPPMRPFSLSRAIANSLHLDERWFTSAPGSSRNARSASGGWQLRRFAPTFSRR